MTRSVRDTNLETRTARMRLAVRPKPYWRVIETGLHLGYRRTKTGGGSWVARRFIGEGRYGEIKLGTADDLGDADGITARSFRQAQDAARDWLRLEMRRDAGLEATIGPYTIAAALDAYFAERLRRGSKGLDKDKGAANARIMPTLGTVEVAKLSTKRLRDWHAALATAPRVARAGAKQPSKPLDTTDEEAVRARRASANRTLTVLKAALNFAFQEGHASADDVWRKVKPFREVDAPVVRFLTIEESRRLINAANGAIRDLVQGALLTGCRYGELGRIVGGDFNAAANTVTLRRTKSAKPRHVALTDEGTMFFAGLVAGRASGELVFRRDDGKAWKASEQKRPLEAANQRATIEPPANFHILRHTYASALAMRGRAHGCHRCAAWTC